MRVEAVLAFGIQCDRCEEIVATAHDKDRPEGYYIAPQGLVRVTQAKKRRTNTQELYLCSKECLIEFVKYNISQSTESV